MIKVFPLSQSNSKDDHSEQIRDIFFLTSEHQEFESAQAKLAFSDRWLNPYLFYYEDTVLIALNEGGHVLGYLTACLDSQNPHHSLKAMRSVFLYGDRFNEFPCHFHINCHPDSQGLGVGKLLVVALEADLRRRNVPGACVVTSPFSENAGFYRHLGFSEEDKRAFKDTEVLFMGKKLTSLPSENSVPV